jgi:hypothetical protein
MIQLTPVNAPTQSRVLLERKEGEPGVLLEATILDWLDEYVCIEFAPAPEFGHSSGQWIDPRVADIGFVARFRPE